jgi:opacity protein-like surface antigen
MKRVLLAISFVAAALAPSWGFYEQGSNVIELEGGLAIHSFKVKVPQSITTLSSHEVSESDDAGSFGGGYLYYLSPWLGFGVNAHYSNKTGGTPLEAIFNGIKTTASEKSFVVLGIAKCSFRVEHRVMPYLLAGVGVHHSARRMTGQPNNALVWSDTSTQEERVLGDGSATGPAVGAGAGIDVPFGENLLMGLEYRYEYLGSVDYGMTALGESLGASLKSSANLINFVFKLGYKF